MQTETLTINSYGKIYRLTNKINGKMYHGQSTKENINDRWKRYKGLHCKNQPKIYNALKKYGPDNFLFEVIDTTPQNQPQLDDLEIDYIAKFDSMNNGYNCDPGGKGGKHSDETKNKMSESHKGKKMSDYNKIALLKANLGRKMSEQSKIRMSNNHKGLQRSEETKLKLSIANKGSNNNMFGKTHSNETKQKMSESLKRHNLLRTQTKLTIQAEQFQSF